MLQQRRTDIFPVLDGEPQSKESNTVVASGDTLPCYADLFFGVVTSEDSLKAVVFTEKTEEIDWTGSHQAWVEQVLRSATIRSFN